MAVVSVFKDISYAMYSLSDAFSQNLVLPFVLNVEPLAMDCVIRFCSKTYAGCLLLPLTMYCTHSKLGPPFLQIRFSYKYGGRLIIIEYG